MQSWAHDASMSHPIPIRAASLGSGKRKWDEDDANVDMNACDRSHMAEFCRQAQLDGACDMAAFYPLPHDLNQAVLRSLGIGGSKNTNVVHANDASTYSSPGLLQPTISTPGDCDMEPVNAHGPRCKSIPQLSVRYYGGTRSQLWAYCPDCHAYSQVHEDQPAILAYSP